MGRTFSQTADSLSVFPNPFSISTTIHFNIVQSDTITLRVINLTGQTLRTIFQSTILSSGSYNIDLLGDSLADDTYFIRLDIGSLTTLTKKIIKNGATLGIADNKAGGNFFVFPNPTDDLITIPYTGKKAIIVTDLNGKIVKSFSTDQQIISLLDIAAGQYFITVLTDKNEKLTTQIILKRE